MNRHILRLKKHSKQAAIGIAGGLVVLIGLVLVPYPGPGWLIVFAGFAILATEFTFADKALQWLKGKYDSWSTWLKKQPRYIQILALGVTAVTVLLTVWLLNTFGLANRLLHLEQPWLISPLFR